MGKFYSHFFSIFTVVNSNCTPFFSQDYYPESILCASHQQYLKPKALQFYPTGSTTQHDFDIAFLNPQLYQKKAIIAFSSHLKINTPYCWKWSCSFSSLKAIVWFIPCTLVAVFCKRLQKFNRLVLGQLQI